MKNTIVLFVIFAIQIFAQPNNDKLYKAPKTDINLSPKYIGDLPEFENTELYETQYREINAVFERYDQLYSDLSYYGDEAIDSLARAMGYDIVNSPLWYASEGAYERPSSPYWRYRGANCGGPEAWVRGFSASSTYPKTSKYTYDASNLEDWDLSTSWVEGRKDYGLGERLYFTFYCTDYGDDSIARRDFTFYNGYTKSKTAWKNNSRVKTLILGHDDSAIATLNLNDIREPQSFVVELPITYNSKELYFEIADFYPGDRWSDVVITEIVAASGGCCFASGTKISMTNGSFRNIESISKGDSVYAIDSKGNHIAAEVRSIVEIVHSNCFTITFSENEITLTEDHPLLRTDGKWATVRGGYSSYVYGETVQLNEGDTVLAKNGKVVIKGINAIKNSLKTYSIKELSVGKAIFANGIAAAVENK